jgi:hypothetical protein
MEYEQAKINLTLAWSAKRHSALDTVMLNIANKRRNVDEHCQTGAMTFVL